VIKEGEQVGAELAVSLSQSSAVLLVGASAMTHQARVPAAGDSGGACCRPDDAAGEPGRKRAAAAPSCAGENAVTRLDGELAVAHLVARQICQCSACPCWAL